MTRAHVEVVRSIKIVTVGKLKHFLPLEQLCELFR